MAIEMMQKSDIKSDVVQSRFLAFIVRHQDPYELQFVVKRGWTHAEQRNKYYSIIKVLFALKVLYIYCIVGNVGVCAFCVECSPNGDF
jgi:hypothetical protein